MDDVLTWASLIYPAGALSAAASTHQNGTCMQLGVLLVEHVIYTLLLVRTPPFELFCDEISVHM